MTSMPKAAIGNEGAYHSWSSMKTRCTNPSRDVWLRYGGRGISVCEQWSGRDGFKTFLRDMGPRPKGTTLDRIDNDGNYEPKNCRWATNAEQSANTSRSHRVTIGDVTDTVSGWAARLGIDNKMLWRRMKTIEGTLAERISEVAKQPRLKPRLPRTGLWGKSIDVSSYHGARVGKMRVLFGIETDMPTQQIACECDCGNRFVTTFAYAVLGKTRSCGCMRGRRPTQPYTGEIVNG